MGRVWGGGCAANLRHGRVLAAYLTSGVINSRHSGERVRPSISERVLGMRCVDRVAVTNYYGAQPCVRPLKHAAPACCICYRLYTVEACVQQHTQLVPVNRLSLSLSLVC